MQNYTLGTQVVYFPHRILLKCTISHSCTVPFANSQLAQRKLHIKYTVSDSDQMSYKLNIF